MLTVEIPALKRLLRSFEVRMKLKELISGDPGAGVDDGETAATAGREDAAALGCEIVAAEDCEDVVAKGYEDVVVSGLSYDSRTTRPGDLFFAVQGTFEDGNAYVSEAIERGAAAVVSSRDIELPPGIPLVLVRDERRAKGALASRFFGHPSRRLKCVGVTGTNGKTTTSHMLRSILEQNGWSTGLIGTIKHLVGKREIQARTTTPDAVDVQRFLAEMVDENQDAAVLEASSHALVQSRTESVRFAVGVFTNLSREHLDYHQTMDEYKKAKSLLFASLDPKATGVVNADDPAGAFMAAACRCPVLTYGLRDRADIRGEIRRLDIDGFSMILRTPAGAIDVTSRLLGRHNVFNALAASGAAVSLGVPLEACKAGLEALSAVPGRVEPIDVGQDFRVIVDYAHTDDALRKLLENLRHLTAGRLITVFGCGGDRDVFKRPLMAQAATTLSDLTIVTSDNPRSEDPLKIIDDILRGCASGSNLRVEPDRRAAIEMAINEARGGDIVAIAGKGHEDYQILNTGVVDFDDREVAKEALWKLSR